MVLKSICCFCFLLLLTNLFAQEPRLVLPTGHIGNVSTVFNKKGDLLLSYSADKTLIWNIKYSKVLIDLQMLNSKVLTATFNADGNKVIAVAEKKGVCIIDIKTAKEEDCFTVKNTLVTSAIIIQNGQQVITCHTDSSIAIWDLAEKKYITLFKLPFVVKQISNFTAETFLTVVADFYDINASNQFETTITKVVNIITKEITDPKPIAAFSSLPVLSSDKFALTYINDIASLTDLKSKKIVQIYDFQEYIFKDIAFSVKENIAAITEDSGIIILDIKTGFATRRNLNGISSIKKIQFIENERKLLLYNYFNDSCYVYDYVKEKVVLSFLAKHDIPHYLSYNKNQNTIAFTSGTDVLIFDTKKWIISYRLNGYASSIQSLNYNAKTHSLLTIHNYKYIKQWDLLSAKLNVSIVDPTFCGVLFGAYYCNNGSQIVIDACEDLKTIWDAATGRQTGDSIYYSVDCTPVIKNNECKNRYSRISINSVDIFDRFTDSLLFSIDSLIAEALSATLSPDGKLIIIIDKNSNVLLWDLQKRKEIMELYENQFKYTYSFTKNFNGAFFNSTGEYFVIESADNHLDLWSISELRILNKFQGSYGTFINDSTIAGINNSTINFYNIKSEQEIFRFIAIGRGKGYMIKLPGNYYLGSEDVVKSVHYINGEKILSFEQLDVKYNRPDKVLEAIGNTDTALINSYKRAYYKRIKKLGIDTTQFNDGYSVPEADFINRDAVDYEQKMEQLNIRIKGIDSNYKLDRFNIWINEVPLFGMKGISIQDRNSIHFDTTITISLSQGENRIETSVTNVNGTESYRMPLYVKYTTATPIKETVHFIGIGINQFADSRRNLQWCVKDIRDIALKLKEKYRDRIIIDTLFDQNVTLSNVQALKQKLLKTNINDKVIIAYSGHGLLSKQYDYYLSSFDVNFSKPEENGIAYEEIENLLDNIPARKKLLLLDACHSGEVDKEEMLGIQTAKTKAGNKGLIMNRGSEEETTETKTVGLQNSFELMQSLFVNVGKGTGTTIISAAGGVQFAQERNDLENGVFTFSLLEAMQKFGNIKVSELKKYVGQRVEQLTNGMQKPTTRNELKDFDWEVW